MDYSVGEIKNALLNWEEIEGTDTLGYTLDLKCDIEMALERLYGKAKRTAYTLLLFGESVIISGAIPQQDMHDVLQEVYQILNVEGLGGEDDYSNSN